MPSIARSDRPPDIDQQALDQLVEAIAAIARRFFTEAMVHDPHVGEGALRQFESKVHLALGKELRATWRAVETEAQRIADDAVRRTFAERAA